MNRQQLRAKLKKSNKEIDRLLIKLGEVPETKEFSSSLVEKLEELNNQEKLEEEASNTISLDSLEDLLKLLSPCEASITEKLKEAHKAMVKRAWEQYVKLSDELTKETIRELAVKEDWRTLESQGQDEGEVIDIEAQKSDKIGRASCRERV